MRLKTLVLSGIVGGALALAVGGAYRHFASTKARENANSASVLFPSATEGEVGMLFPIHETPLAVPNLSFVDAEGRETGLRAFGGKTVLLNVWATWCVPCREEMPALDRLAAQLGSSAFQVVPLSIDRSGLEKVKEFYRELGLEDLPVYVDETGKASQQLATVGIPTTLLIGPEGVHGGDKPGQRSAVMMSSAAE